MVTLLTTLQVFACLILIVSVLLQPSKGGAALGGSSQSVFGSTGGTTFLFRTTMTMAAFIMISSLYLSRYRIEQAKSSVINSTSVLPTLPPAAAPAPKAPEAPAPSQPTKTE